MKLTEELIKCQTREAQRQCEEHDVYLDAESYESGALWVFYAMKDQLWNSKADYFCFGFLAGGLFAFLLTQFVL